jgi:hypothetical protein
MNISTGWVGFFDILGYANLLQRNEPELIAEEVVPLLTGAHSEIIDGICTTFESWIAKFTDNHQDSQSLVQNARILIDDLKWLLFSDTILITMRSDESTDRQSVLRWIIFYWACADLQVKLFRAGLPLRGAIDFGRFFIKDTCFAGRPIINAYELCNMLELAACVLSKAASHQLHGLKGFEGGADACVSGYLVPTKTEERRFFVTRAVVYERNIDIRQQVMNAFWGHRKDVSIDAQKKASNTEQWLRYLTHLEEKKAAQQKSATDVLPPVSDA